MTRLATSRTHAINTTGTDTNTISIGLATHFHRVTGLNVTFLQTCRAIFLLTPTFPAAGPVNQALRGIGLAVETGDLCVISSMAHNGKAVNRDCSDSLCL